MYWRWLILRLGFGLGLLERLCQSASLDQDEGKRSVGRDAAFLSAIWKSDRRPIERLYRVARRSS